MSDFAADLAELGFSKGGFASHFGLHRNTVYGWGNNPPVGVRLYLDARLNRASDTDEDAVGLAVAEIKDRVRAALDE